MLPSLHLGCLCTFFLFVPAHVDEKLEVQLLDLLLAEPVAHSLPFHKRLHLCIWNHNSSKSSSVPGTARRETRKHPSFHPPRPQKSYGSGFNERTAINLNVQGVIFRTVKLKLQRYRVMRKNKAWRVVMAIIYRRRDADSVRFSETIQMFSTQKLVNITGALTTDKPRTFHTWS